MNQFSPTQNKLVFLFDVDNTLLDHDQVTADLRKHLDSQVGVGQAKKYWEMFEELRGELGYADYLGALQRYRLAFPRDPHLLIVSQFLIHYPFTQRLFPGAVEAVRHVERWGTSVILSDGDVVFQPHKIQTSGLQEVFGSRALIYIHKEKEMDHVQERFPAEHYVLIDDKLRILAAVKATLGTRVTTIFVRQGHYAMDSQAISKFPQADVTLEKIGDLATHDFSCL